MKIQHMKPRPRASNQFKCSVKTENQIETIENDMGSPRPGDWKSIQMISKSFKNQIKTIKNDRGRRVQGLKV